MARSTILFALAATILALAAFSAQAHKQALPAPPASRKHPRHHAPPHSAAKRKHADERHPLHKTYSHHAPAPAPVDGKGAVLPPEPHQGFYSFVDRCLEKLTEECGRAIFRGIFWKDEVAISGDCCVKLVAMGRRCHRAILKATLKLPELPKREKKDIKRRDVKIWSECVFVNDVVKHLHGQ